MAGYSQRRWLGAGLLLACGVSAPLAAQGPEGRLDDRLAREFSVEVRAADLGELAARLSSALNVRLTTDPLIANQRVSVYASKARIAGLLEAVGALLHSSWQRTGEPGDYRYRLVNNSAIQAQARRLAEQRRAAFVAKLLRLQNSMRPGREEAAVSAVRATVARNYPFLPQETLDEITPDYLRQALLLLPSRQTVVPALTRSRAVWLPFRTLPPRYQQLLAAFFLEQAQSAPNPPAGSVPNPAVLDMPQARLDYRLIYGDRWTGPVLLTRVGATENWATAVMPSSLFSLPDDSVLYPEIQTRPVSAALLQPVKVRIDTDAQTWEQALAALAKAAGINVLSDSFPRPDVFPPAQPGPVIEGTTLTETLDRVAAYYGCFWWKSGEWYLFRHRRWADEQRVTTPESLLRAFSATLAGTEHLSAKNIGELAALSDEQLLTLHLSAGAGGKVAAPADAFDYSRIEAARAGLLLYAQLTEQQRELARGAGLPYSLMSPVQQFAFASLAYDRGFTGEGQPAWRFRVADEFHRERLPAGWAELGMVRLIWDYGTAGQRQTDLAVRTPAEPPKAAAPAADAAPLMQ